MGKLRVGERLFWPSVNPGGEVTSAVAQAAGYIAYSIKKQRTNE